MSIVLDLPTELEHDLDLEAKALSLSISDYIHRLLLETRSAASVPRNGAELVDYWIREGLVGTRADSIDPSAHARLLREQAERRGRG